MERIVDRFDKYMEMYRLKDLHATKILGIAGGLMTRYRKSLNTDYSERIVSLILEKFTNINEEWLRYGNGEMLNGSETPACLFGRISDNTPQPNSSSSAVHDIHTSNIGNGNGGCDNGLVSAILKQNEAQQAQIKELMEMNKKLLEVIVNGKGSTNPSI